MDKKLFSHDLVRALGSTTYALAQKTGLSYQQLLKVVNGHCLPSITTARVLADTLNIPLDALQFKKETEVCQSQN